MKNYLIFIPVLLLIGVLTANHPVKTMNKSQALCVGAKWLQVGSSRFWQRKSCVKRRQYGTGQVTPPGGGGREGVSHTFPVPTLPGKGGGGGEGGIGGGEGGGEGSGGEGGAGLDQKNTTGRNLKTASTISIDELLPSLEAGPVRGSSYKPNYGYEPYWSQGDWVFDRDDGTKDKNLYMCGIRCPKIYTEYGKICGRNKDAEYKTFANYCQLKNEDCSNIKRWKALYRGECFRALTVYKDKNERLHIYIQNETRDAIINFMKTYTADNNVGRCTDCVSMHRIDYRKK